MTDKQDFFDETQIANSLAKEWEALCDRFLPHGEAGSIWRFNRYSAPDDLKQGFKLHISATILHASNVFAKIAPYLVATGVMFKAARSLLELKRLNCGLFYGFSQVGKFVTLYPQSTEQALEMATHLHELTREFPGPAVAYDLPYAACSRVFYRYGGFANREFEDTAGRKIPAIASPTGELVPDRREPGAAVPEWVTNPFPPVADSALSDTADNLLRTTIYTYEALTQRGKGGVYRALDLSQTPGRLAIIKEGRRHGEVDWEGRDGFWRVQNEARVLHALRDAGVEVPEVYYDFQVGNNDYLVMEEVRGENLNKLLVSRKRKLPLADAIRYGSQIARLIGQMHAAGWAWRDCKPLNMVLTDAEQIRPLDFEGACRVDALQESPWGTNGYLPPEWMQPGAAQHKQDLYALGATLHYLFTGHAPQAAKPLPAVGRLRKHVPIEIRRIIAALLDADPQKRPEAYEVHAVLAAAPATVESNRSAC